MVIQEEIKAYKLLDVNFPPSPPIKNAKLYVLNHSTQKVEVYITDKFGTPKPLKDDVGSIDKHYTHTQAIASSTWNITHNLGKFPSVTIVDSAGDERDAEVKHINNNSLIIIFLSANSGKVYLN